MKKRIMHITQANGGVARYLQMLFKYMDRNKYEQILIYPNEYDYEKKDFKNLVDNIEFIDIYREINLKKDIISIYKLYKLIKKYNPDLIYVHSSKAGALGRIANSITRKPIIYNPHGWAFNMNVSNKKKFIYKTVEKILAKRCDKIIAISEEEKNVAINNKICNLEKIQVIFNGIDIDEYENSIKNETDYREKFNIPNNYKIIGMVGRISEGKAPDIFVKVACKIKEKIPNTFFIIVGDGEERESIENMIENLGLKKNFLITGWVEDTYRYIKMFDIAMLLTRWEGFGLAVAEYMISKKPIIATNVGAIPNLITSNENGILVEVDNVLETVQAIIKINNNEKFSNYIVKNADIKVRTKFDVRRVALEHQRVIDKLI
ncbi:glycosyltransferase family 4 protein [Clostridium botulinum]|uniref:Glycosyltransferase family 4 protein n=1 Tax=Clostridium botulinum TaxID=1491 RepID=A0A6B4RX31_CLOBO|nr:glycosyltransferase family 4 protein [Clostridium botulinum]MCS6111600.1 glycosyltransferase family 1 protein [Clostridium botulinum]NFE11019.1 glycosyltransferase family 4 protein [Clostridium botulinum]NFE60303.1 glycosyltransferase family 4 protein [Clostridium botulinum]NFE84153.1 glycosyltransferase family 4 protein [Clostridium botulinum]NFF87943.1 glycosyltransferase family 4 protein [Clostridium botulinum]